MEKHTKEYAEELALDYIGGEIVHEIHRNIKNGFREGYLKAIEENAVPELVALIKDLLEYHSNEEYRSRCDTLAEEATGGNVTHLESILVRAEWLIEKATT